MTHLWTWLNLQMKPTPRTPYCWLLLLWHLNAKDRRLPAGDARKGSEGSKMFNLLDLGCT